MTEQMMTSLTTGIQNEHHYEENDEAWLEKLRKEVEEEEERRRNPLYYPTERKKLDIYKEDRKENPQTPVIDPYQED